LLYLGNGDAALPLAGTPAMRALILASSGRPKEVAALLEEQVLTRPGIGTVEDASLTRTAVVLLEAAVLTQHREAAGLLLRRFAGIKHVSTGTWQSTSIARHLGAAAALLGKIDEA